MNGTISLHSVASVTITGVQALCTDAGEHLGYLARVYVIATNGDQFEVVLHADTRDALLIGAGPAVPVEEPGA